jgi:hypothetical protein
MTVLTGGEVDHNLRCDMQHRRRFSGAVALQIFNQSQEFFALDEDDLHGADKLIDGNNVTDRLNRDEAKSRRREQPIRLLHVFSGELVRFEPSLDVDREFTHARHNVRKCLTIVAVLSNRATERDDRCLKIRHI